MTMPENVKLAKPSAAAEKLNLRIKEICNNAHKESGVKIEELIGILSHIIGQFEVAYMVDHPNVDQANIEAMVIRNSRLGAEVALRYLHEQNAVRIISDADLHGGNGSKN